MGQIFANIHLRNPADDTVASISLNALVDTGSLFLCLPATIVAKLGLKEYDRRCITTADGSSRWVPYVGPIKINFLNRMCITGALVVGDMPLLGAIPIEDMDLVIHPAQLSLTVNPANPVFADRFIGHSK